MPQQEKGSLREALSNNDQPGDLRTVTLSFHTQRKAVIMGGETQRPRGGELQAGQGMPSIKIDLHYSEFSTNSLKEQGIISFWWRAGIVLGGAVEKSCLWQRVLRNDLPFFLPLHTTWSTYWQISSDLFLNTRFCCCASASDFRFSILTLKEKPDPSASLVSCLKFCFLCHLAPDVFIVHIISLWALNS